ncbi:potassium voltage-gated channel subfamily G member 2, partial [Melanerpes formicivorus]|uniref:potassium voltage-gated channel subfamily G member 2 n=1 Tax=Melanerpes formicivorus TaxID=211600 RepID=UPI00358DE627
GEELHHPAPRSGCAIINVGGSRYQVPWSRLEGCPLGRLGRLRSCRSREELLQVCDDFDASRDEFFFDRSPGAFRCIVALLGARKLRLLRGTCALSFQEELRYWGVGQQHLERCCRQRLRQRQEEAAEAALAAGQEAAAEPSVPAPRGGGRLAPCMGRLRDMVENPRSGIPGKVFACISISFVAITTVSLCISTMPEVRQEEEQGECSGRCQALLVLEAVCVGWFSLELLLRWLPARDRCAFLRAPLTLIDGLALLPFYVSLLLRLLRGPGAGPAAGRLAERAGLALRLLRALRLLSLARHSLGLRSLGLTARRCARHCGLLLLFLGLAVALFSPLVHLAESELGARQEFRSVPGTYWWAVISMTTVGYGDMVPRSVPGQVAALSGILSGILLMAFPVTSIFHTFSRSYSELRERQRRDAARRPCPPADGAGLPAGPEGRPGAGQDAKGSAGSEETETRRNRRQGGAVLPEPTELQG